MKKLLVIILLTSVLLSCKKNERCGHITKIYVMQGHIFYNGKQHFFTGNAHIEIDVNGKLIDKSVSMDEYNRVKNSGDMFYCFD